MREETSVDDIGGMYVVEGILIVWGGMILYVVVVVWGWGKLCVSGCGVISFKNDCEICFGTSDRTYRVGYTIFINGVIGEVIDVEFVVVLSMIDIFLFFKILMYWVDEKCCVEI